MHELTQSPGRIADGIAQLSSYHIATMVPFSYELLYISIEVETISSF